MSVRYQPEVINMSVRYQPEVNGVFMDDTPKIGPNAAKPHGSENSPDSNGYKPSGQRISRSQSLSSSDLTKYHHRHPCKIGYEKFGGRAGNEPSPPGTIRSRQKTRKPTCKGFNRSMSESRSCKDRNKESKAAANYIDEPGDVCRESGSENKEVGECECWKFQEPSRIKLNLPGGIFARFHIPTRKDEYSERSKQQLDRTENCSRTVEESLRIEPNVPTGKVVNSAISGESKYDRQESSECMHHYKETTDTERTPRIPTSNVPDGKIDSPEISGEGKCTQSNRQEELGDSMYYPKTTAGGAERILKSNEPVGEIKSPETYAKSKHPEVNKEEINKYKFNARTKDHSSRSKQSNTIANRPQTNKEESYYTSEIDRELNTCKIYGTLEDFSRYLSEYGKKHNSTYTDIYTNSEYRVSKETLYLNRTYLEPSEPTGFAYRSNSDNLQEGRGKTKCISNPKGIDAVSPDCLSAYPTPISGRQASYLIPEKFVERDRFLSISSKKPRRKSCSSTDI